MSYRSNPVSGPPVDPQKRRDAVKALVNLVLLESMLLAVVVGVYLYTDKLAYLIGGVIGSALIFTPAFIRWAKEHGTALKEPAEKK
jgi:hypothetical protein